MTSRSTWKRLERKTAKMLGGKRNPLSGGSGGHTRGDVIHPELYVECKLRARHSLFSLFRGVEENARLEGKVPLLVLKEKGRRGELAVVRLDLLIELLKHD